MVLDSCFLLRRFSDERPATGTYGGSQNEISPPTFFNSLAALGVLGTGHVVPVISAIYNFKILTSYPGLHVSSRRDNTASKS